MNGGNTIGATAVSTLELGAGGQQGTLGGLGTQFINFQHVTIDTNSSWSLTGINDLIAGASLANLGTLVINGALLTNGAILTSAGLVTIASASSVVASARVTAGGGWTETSALVIGDKGAGSFLVDNNASASVASAILGASAGGTGDFDVAGPTAIFSASGMMTLGDSGRGRLTVENQGTALIGDPANANPGLELGKAESGAGEVLVTGAGSSLRVTGLVIVGDAGPGQMSIQAGGTVVTSLGAAAGIGDLVIGNAASSSGSTVNVIGAGSSLQMSGTLIVGGAAFGQLSISQSATVTAASGDEAMSSGGGGAITVSDIGTALNIAGLLTVGDQSSGSLNIDNGASVSVGGLSIGAGAGGSGNVVIGPGSHLTLTGTNINVGLAGSAVLDIQGGTLGLVSGTTLSPGTFGRIVQVGGLIDPATVFDASGGSFGGGGTVEASGTIVNSSLATVSGGSETLLAPLITSSDSINVAGVWSIKSGGTLLLDVNTFDNSQTIQFADLTGVLTIGQQVTLDATQTPQPIAKSALDGFAAPIVAYKAGDKITFTGSPVASDSVSGNVVTLFDSGYNTLGSLSFLKGNGNPDPTGASLAAAQIACFAAGTWIETADGPRAVEELVVGDRAVLADGGCEPIVWVGYRVVNCAAHPRPETVWPVRVAAGAFGENVPVRDLYLSPDHAVFVNDVLVPVKLLINGTTITQVKRGRVRYFHVELPRHAVILADGLAVESYLNVGDRANFDGSRTIRLFPDFGARLAPDVAIIWETRGVAPLIMAGGALAAARRATAVGVPGYRSVSATS